MSGKDQRRRGPGELESALLDVLVGADRPLTPGDVREKLPAEDPLSYSTVVTILTRMYAKGVLARYRDGRAFRYAPLTDGPSLTAQRMGRLLDADADHETVLQRFVAGLGPGDEAVLRRLLSETRGDEELA
ncbi:BlaI/MecI/CopY family transcriptional regulator [Actinoplanes bogorensis]|uniref:BlaI/MecI/CopY family transcriptional regulator n=1 Tax=Paractinoplanes bogorensis TaxID=1610840 RepID=A0ABS5YJK2_9ACTN|nr:BlaI/MecI/CopY family transcriptional regulator [Actinoplanes bogorensis]MBU2663655.1 BlaI/MecI/CopY family transcriptional regulator [Actinoplanes bogorensis]